MLEEYLVSVGEIEAQTGLDFLTVLPEEVQESLEVGIGSGLWPVKVADDGPRTSDLININTLSIEDGVTPET